MLSLGTMRLDPIIICPYDPSSVESFARQRDQIAPFLRNWITGGIEHMGSTAVRGLATKPIIDMVAIVDDIHAKRDATGRFDSVGWAHAPEPSDEAERKLSFVFLVSRDVPIISTLSKNRRVTGVAGLPSVTT
jgi:GrpB-like predicted nucleotidyltransferase (UPF0157 family)